MALQLPLLLLGCLVQQATALAQVAASSAEHLALHGLGHRTALHHGRSNMATAEVGKLGEVGLRLNEDTQVIISIGDDVVVGSLMLLTVNPQHFIRNASAQRAVQEGIKDVALVLRLDLRDVGIELVWSEDFPQTVRVDFEVGFHTARSRQVFTWHVVTDSAKQLVDGMCRRMPSPWKDRCQLPGTSQPQSDGSIQYLNLVGSDSEEVAGGALPSLPRCNGTLYIVPQEPPQLLMEDPVWKEALAMAIAEEALVSRRQVGTMMAVERNSLRVDFWLTQASVRCSEAIGRVVRTQKSIMSRVAKNLDRWSSDKQILKDFPVYGRLVLDVPSPQLFARNKSAAEAVRRALARVAAAPGPEVLELPVKGVNVSLAKVGNQSDALLVGFQVFFNGSRDRQVFAWDFAATAAETLADEINEQLPNACKGRCRLPGKGLAESAMGHGNLTWTQEAELPTYAELGKRFGTFLLAVPVGVRVNVARDPLVHEAMAMAISEIASVRSEEVGVSVATIGRASFYVDFWVASRNATLRQVAVLRMERAGFHKFARCALAQLDRIDTRARSTAPDVTYGSVVLHVPDAVNFTKSAQVYDALRRAIAQVAAVPREQVQYLYVRSGLWEESPQLVRVDLGVAGDPQGQDKNFTRALAVDGGKKLATIINELVPKPFKGQCRLPGMDLVEDLTVGTTVNSSMINSTIGMRSEGTTSRPAGKAALVPQPSQLYGTMLIYTFKPALYVREHSREGIATTIAEVAGVPRSQVGLAVAAQSDALLTVDFWVVSQNATLRQVAVQRVNAKWTNSDLKLIWSRQGYSWVRGVSMVSGGTVAGGVARYKC